jgi:phospholipid N-methyltransferase
MQNVIEVLQACTVNRNVVHLPAQQLDRDMYLAVKNKLEKIGGHWKGGKIQGFLFEHDPAELLAEITQGKDRNLKKEFQYFPTSPDIARRLLTFGPTVGVHRVLEPSAGQGAIVEAILQRYKYLKEVSCCELMPQNMAVLRAKKGVRIIGEDFLQLGFEFDNFFDLIVANPPFANNQDIDHIRKMYDVCNPGGTIVSIASIHWHESTHKKEKAFKSWLEELGAEIHFLPPGTFEHAGTKIASCYIYINKPIG